MTSTSLAEEWLEFVRLAVPADARQGDLEQYRKVFYCGAGAALNVLTSDHARVHPMEATDKLRDEIAAILKPGNHGR